MSEARTCSECAKFIDDACTADLPVWVDRDLDTTKPETDATECVFFEDKIPSPYRAVYCFHYSVPRFGSLTGTFTTTGEEIADIIGKRIQLSDALGKHSVINITLAQDQFQFITDDILAVLHIEKLAEKGITLGVNPFDYLDEEDEEEDEDEDEADQ